MAIRIKLPESCRQVARHASRNHPWANPASSEVRCPQSCSDVASGAEMWPKFGQPCPISAMVGPITAKFGLHRTKLDQQRSMSAKSFADFGHAWPKSEQSRPKLAATDRFLAELGHKVWSRLNKLVRTSSEFGQFGPHWGPNHDFWSTFERSSGCPGGEQLFGNFVYLDCL